MELESTAKDPLLPQGPELKLESANSYEDSIPVYNQYAPDDTFSFNSLMLCSCINSRNSLTQSEFQSFNKLSSFCKEPLFIDKDSHRRMLIGIWREVFPDEEPPSDQRLSHENWKTMGFQNTSPDSDFRGGGLMALKNLRDFVENNKTLSLEIIRQQEKNEFLLAVSSINTSFFLRKYFLMAEPADYKLEKDNAVCSKGVFKSFCGFLAEDSDVLDKMHDLLLKDVYFTWKKKKERDPTMNIMAFNAVFCEAQVLFHRKINKLHRKGFEIIEKFYANERQEN